MDETYIKAECRRRNYSPTEPPCEGGGQILVSGSRFGWKHPGFLLTARRDAKAAKRFFHKTMLAAHTQESRVINVDKNAAYPKAIDKLKTEKELPLRMELRQNKYLNNLVEQDYRFIKRLTRSGIGFHSFNTARRTLRGFEAMNMLCKRQIMGVEKGDVSACIEFRSQIFGVAA